MKIEKIVHVGSDALRPGAEAGGEWFSPRGSEMKC
jgi:hypothetical protein